MNKMLSVLLSLALVFPVFLICDPCADASGPVWKKEYIKDVFGDPLDEYVLTNSDDLIGTYNNSQVNDGYLRADMFFQRDGDRLRAYIKLYEDGVDQVKNGSDLDISYNVAVKCPDGSKYAGDAEFRSTADRIELNQAMTLANALCATAGEVMVYLEESDNALNNYLFKVPCGNFYYLFEEHIINTYLEEQYQYAIKLFKDGSLDQAAEVFNEIIDYSDSASYLDKIKAAGSSEDTQAKNETTAPASEEAPQDDGTFQKVRHAEITVKDYGTIKLELDEGTAPITVANFVKLAKDGFYDGLTFHRIMDGFMIQGGDPRGNGTGGSDEKIKGEFKQNGVDNPISHVKGVISMARSNHPDSASSQFFITVADATFLDGSYAAFGRGTEGMEVAEKIAKDVKPVDNSGSVMPDEQPVIESIVITD